MNNAKGIYGKVLGLFLTVLCGGNRYSHYGWWNHGATALKATFGVTWLPLASTTLARFWGKINNQKTAERWMDAARTFARQIMNWMKITRDYLCLDSTVLTRYGVQEGAKFRGWKDELRAAFLLVNLNHTTGKLRQYRSIQSLNPNCIFWVKKA